MKKEFRIKKTSEIDEIFKLKHVKGNPYFVVYTKACEELHFRYALSIGKKYGKATARNLAKRRTRAIILMNSKEIKPMLFVVVIKPKASELTYLEFKNQLESVFKKAKII